MISVTWLDVIDDDALTHADPVHISSTWFWVLYLKVPVSGVDGCWAVVPWGKTTPYVPANLTYPVPVSANVSGLLVWLVIVLSLNRIPLTLIFPVPEVETLISVELLVFVIVLLLKSILPNTALLVFNLDESNVAITLLLVANLIILSADPSVNSGVM